MTGLWVQFSSTDLPRVDHCCESHNNGYHNETFVMDISNANIEKMGNFGKIGSSYSPRIGAKFTFELQVIENS